MQVFLSIFIILINFTIYSISASIEQHNIITEDGYILALHRITPKNSTQKTPVLLSHGILSSSADFLNLGNKLSLGLILAESGYDVWLVNHRGNGYSRNHTNFTPQSNPEKFFDIGVHELGYYDLPSAIDHILGTTRQENLHYIGFSQGCAAFMVMATARPEYNSRIRLASLMAPAVFFVHTDNPIVLSFCRYNLESGEKLLKKLGIFEVPYTDQLRSFLSVYCKSTKLVPTSVCKAFFVHLGGTINEQFVESMLPHLFTYFPSNTALKQFYQFCQWVRSGTFSQYDYGSGKNLEKYGTMYPPKYNLSMVSTPVALYSGSNDWLAKTEDVMILERLLPNVVTHYQVPYRLFGHLDFVTAKDVYHLVYISRWRRCVSRSWSARDPNILRMSNFLFYLYCVICML